MKKKGKIEKTRMKLILSILVTLICILGIIGQITKSAQDNLTLQNTIIDQSWEKTLDKWHTYRYILSDDITLIEVYDRPGKKPWVRIYNSKGEFITMSPEEFQDALYTWFALYLRYLPKTTKGE